MNLLLIEPVWNRNRNGRKTCDEYLEAFNRTSMESKHTLRPNKTDTCFTFNRTSMESKHELPYQFVGVWAFNRTSMESKLPRPSILGQCPRLLIEPVWNRNVDLPIDTVHTEDF